MKKRELRREVRKICRSGKYGAVNVVILYVDDDGVECVHDISQQYTHQLMRDNHYVYGTIIDDAIVRGDKSDKYKVEVYGANPVHD